MGRLDALPRLETALDVGDQQGPARPEGIEHRLRRPGVGQEPLQLGGGLGVGELDAGEGDAPHAAVVLDDVDRAPIGEGGDNEVGHLLENGGEVRRRREQDGPAHLQERQPTERVGLVFGDVGHSTTLARRRSRAARSRP